MRSLRALLALFLLALAPVAIPAAAPGAPQRVDLIAFTSNRDGNPEIYTMSPDGSNVSRLTNNQAVDSNPAISPDGTRIAFESNRTGNYQVYVMHTDGSGVVRLTNSPRQNFTPSWSPDGTRIALMSTMASAAPEIYVMNADGSGVVRLTNNNALDADPAFSPMANVIAFTSDRQGMPQIYTMNSDGSGVTRVTHDAGVDVQPAWSPDGSDIAYTSNAAGNADIWVTNAEGTLVKQLTTDPSDDSSATWSPGGSQLAFTSSRTGTKEIFTMDATGTNQKPITHIPTDHDNPNWGSVPVGNNCFRNVSGWLEPSQAVWQDDQFWIPKTLGDFLVQNSDTSYTANLAMVKDKPTLVFGIYQAKDKPVVDKREIVRIEVTTNCTQTIPVDMRFTSDGAGGNLDVTEKIKGAPPLPVSGCCLPKPKTIDFDVDAAKGVPIPPKKAFTFGSTGAYTITAELVQPPNMPTGVKVTVSGTVVSTTGPLVHFIPAYFGGRDPDTVKALQDRAKELADASAKYIPDFYPLKPGGLPTDTQPAIQLTSASKKKEDQYLDWIKQVTGAVDKLKAERLKKEAAIAETNREAAAATLVGGGDRAVILLSDNQYSDRIAPPTKGEKFYKQVAQAASSKVIFMSMQASKLEHLGIKQRPGYVEVAHELAHTIPKWLWSGPEMNTECGDDYHAPERTEMARGFRVTNGGVEGRERVEPPRVSIMGPADGGPWWIDLCTYSHLLTALQGPLDPSTILVQGRLGRANGKQIGELFPLYQIPGHVDLSSGGIGAYAIVLRDAGGAELGRFPFEAHWGYENGGLAQIQTFTYRVPDLPGVAQVDLEGPNGLLDSKTYSASPPSVSISTPASGASVKPVHGRVDVSWTASGSSGHPLLSTVEYSPDGGATWQVVSIEQAGTTASVPVSAGAHDHMVEVVVTDGTRSTTSTVSFSTP